MIRVLTPDTVYRGFCKGIETEGLSVILADAERLAVFGHSVEERWEPVSDLLIISGDYVETIYREKTE